MKVLVLGGAGYSGSVLVRELLARGDNVTVVDNFWFGDWLGESPHLSKIKTDISDTHMFPEGDFEAVVQLANIANDPAVELSPVLSWEVNVLASQHIAEWAISRQIPQIIYASSGSVYGVKTESSVTEDLSLVPISAYNKTKMVAERVFLSYADQIRVHLIRPATICGVSPRMRFDLTVNMLTLQAVRNGEITVFGGKQVRPNIHIDDVVAVYMHFLDNPSLASGPYNAGFQNLTVLEVAEMLSSSTGASVIVSESNDPRSYRLDSSKLLATGFVPSKSIDDAIRELMAYISGGADVSRPEWFTVSRMQNLGLGEKTHGN